MEEFWKYIKEYEGFYQVSNLGRVKSLAKYQKGNGGSIFWRKETILKPANSGRGYLMVVLIKNKKRKSYILHRLVADAFIPNPYNLPQVNHKDENKTNNFVYINEDGTVNLEKSNLEWCDNKYNSNYGTRNIRIIQTRKAS